MMPPMCAELSTDIEPKKKGRPKLPIGIKKQRHTFRMRPKVKKELEELSHQYPNVSQSEWVERGVQQMVKDHFVCDS